MSSTVTLNVPLNRVEGDLELRVKLDQGTVVDAWCSGTMYRGFENIMIGRGVLDGLVITPRICGICTTSHLRAAVAALETIAGVTPPPDSVRLRDVVQLTEHVQSDVRHAFLTFASDFINAAYETHPLYGELRRRYEPFRGETVVEVLRETKKLLEIVAIVGGQWPHSSFMVPGGVVSLPSPSDLLQCRLLLRHFRKWYEERVLGCSLGRWRAVKSAGDLDEWLSESNAHSTSDLGVYLRFTRDIGLHEVGRGPSAFLTFSSSTSESEGSTIGAFAQINGGSPDKTVASVCRETFDQAKIAEHVRHSWFVDYAGGKHPLQGVTEPYATGMEGEKYSWAKAPRYEGRIIETGPLADAVISGDPLVTDLVLTHGSSAFSRQLARLVRPASLIPRIERLLTELASAQTPYISPGEIENGEGVGLTNATRGALGHWVSVADGKITHYQIITPTAWHASPRDSDARRGPIEQALVGTIVKDPDNPVELGHVVRSFDCCLVCTVHTVYKGGRASPTTYRI